MTRRAVAILRAEALNPYELQAYTPLCNRFEILAVGRQRPLHEIARIEVPVTLLPSMGTGRTVRALHRRLPLVSSLLPDPTFLRGLSSLVGRYDILHAAETVLPVSEQAAGIARRTGSKLLLTCWETIPFRFDDDPKLAKRKRLVKQQAAMYIAVTARARDALVEEGVPPHKIQVIPAAVDCRRFRTAEPSAELRKLWGVPANALIVLYVGRLIQEKGVTELVRAFAHSGHSTAHLVYIGSGDQADRLRTAAAALGVSARVHIRPAMSYGDLPAAYGAVDVVVAPSLTTPYWEEQFGMVLVEAMACGKPLLTTASGAIPEVVGGAAELVEPYDVPALSAALAMMLASPERRSHLAGLARARAETKFDVPVVSVELERVYDRLFAGC